jgi:hypothetical protein
MILVLWLILLVILGPAVFYMLGAIFRLLDNIAEDCLKICIWLARFARFTCRWSWRGARALRRVSGRFGLWTSQRAYTLYYGTLCYRIPRAFIARQLRELRHIRRHRART